VHLYDYNFLRSYVRVSFRRIGTLARTSRHDRRAGRPPLNRSTRAIKSSAGTCSKSTRLFSPGEISQPLGRQSKRPVARSHSNSGVPSRSESAGRTRIEPNAQGQNSRHHQAGELSVVRSTRLPRADCVNSAQATPAQFFVDFYQYVRLTGQNRLAAGAELGRVLR
jgi:hypothetical protein